jgi:hypothetical protein
VAPTSTRQVELARRWIGFWRAATTATPHESPRRARTLMAGVVDLPTIWRLHRNYAPLIAGRPRRPRTRRGPMQKVRDDKSARDVFSWHRPRCIEAPHGSRTRRRIIWQMM